MSSLSTTTVEPEAVNFDNYFSGIQTAFEHIYSLSRLHHTVSQKEVLSINTRKMLHIVLEDHRKYFNVENETIALEDDEERQGGFLNFIGGLIKAIWKAIKEVFKRIWDFFRKIFGFIKDDEVEDKKKDAEKKLDKLNKPNDLDDKVVKIRKEKQKKNDEEATTIEPIVFAKEPPLPIFADDQDEQLFNFLHSRIPDTFPEEIEDIFPFYNKDVFDYTYFIEANKMMAENMALFTETSIGFHTSLIEFKEYIKPLEKANEQDIVHDILKMSPSFHRFISGMGIVHAHFRFRIKEFPKLRQNKPRYREIIESLNPDKTFALDMNQIYYVEHPYRGVQYYFYQARKAVDFEMNRRPDRTVELGNVLEFVKMETIRIEFKKKIKSSMPTKQDVNLVMESAAKLKETYDEFVEKTKKYVFASEKQQMAMLDNAEESFKQYLSSVNVYYKDQLAASVSDNRHNMYPNLPFEMDLVAVHARDFMTTHRLMSDFLSILKNYPTQLSNFLLETQKYFTLLYRLNNKYLDRYLEDRKAYNDQVIKQLNEGN